MSYQKTTWVNGQTPINADNLNKIEEGIAANSPVLLWTNASPTSAFEGQTISLDLSGYDAVEIEFRKNTSVNLLYYEKCKIGWNADVQSMWNIDISSNATVVYRSFTVSESGITFANSVYKSSPFGTTVGNNNNYMIPYKIYGIKGV